MTTFIDGPAVTLADIAKVTKTPVAQLEAECRQLNIFIGCDWAKRPAISPAEAHGLVTGRLRETHDHERRWLDYRLAAEEWVQNRDEAVATASREAAARVGNSMESRKTAQDAGLKAGREAGRKFEEAHPAPLDPDGNLSWVNAQPRYLEPGLFRRALDKLAGVA